MVKEENKKNRERWIKAYLLAVPGLGNKTFNLIRTRLEKEGLSWEAVATRNFAWLKKERGDFSLNKKQKLGFAELEKKWTVTGWSEYLNSRGIKVVLSGEENYPCLLEELVEGDRPEILYVRGEIANLRQEPKIAMVGTRRMTSYGRLATTRIAREIVEEGGVVVSGFMYGVDVTAQKTAMQANGKTIGVLGYGFDFCFPRGQKDLMEEMIEGGQTFVTEYAPFVEARKGSFPMRNRIVAGMSWGTVVVEAAERSGSLITADLAVEYGREVLAVPGPITNPYSVGTKELIKEGAILVGSGYEVMQELRGELERKKRKVWTREDLINEEESDGEHKSGDATESSELLQLSLEGLILKLLKERGGNLSGDEIEGEKELKCFDLEALQVALTMLSVAGKVKREGECWILMDCR